jgi:hypothetical protein
MEMSRPSSRRCSNSNPGFIEASEGFNGKRQHEIEGLLTLVVRFRRQEAL